MLWNGYFMKHNLYDLHLTGFKEREREREKQLPLKKKKTVIQKISKKWEMWQMLNLLLFFCTEALCWSVPFLYHKWNSQWNSTNNFFKRVTLIFLSSIGWSNRFHYYTLTQKIHTLLLNSKNNQGTGLFFLAIQKTWFLTCQSLCLFKFVDMELVNMLSRGEWEHRLV